MKRRIEHILCGYGSDATIYHADGAQAVRAFIQPVTERGKQAAELAVDALGEIPAGRYLYIGPAQPQAMQDDIIECDGRKYRVCRTEQLCLQAEALYTWALLRRVGGEEAWNI